MKNNEFIDGVSKIYNNEIFYERSENNIDIYSFWVDYSCYRRSKGMNQFCKVNIEVSLKKKKKIVSYRELKVEDLKFEEVM